MNDASKPLAPQSLDAGFLTPTELRARWKVTGMTLWRLRKKGALPSFKLGTRVRYRVSDILKIEEQSAV